MAADAYEQVLYCHDAASGLRAIIAIHNTTLGPALGGIRMRPYASETDALEDVLRLAKAMTYKSAVAGLDLGGGKTVIIGGPEQKSEALFRSLGRFIQSMGGRYVAATDVGTTGDDLTYVRTETPYVTGVPVEWGGLGDTSILTGLTVYLGMKAGAEAVWGSESLSGKRIAVQGAGKVGMHLMEHLHAEGANLFVADVLPESAARAADHFGATIVPEGDIYDVECDVFAPCSLGAVLNEGTIPRLRCKLVCGGANNQLALDQDGERLNERGILYAPDFVVNSGGVISAAAELRKAPLAWAEGIARRVGSTTRGILAQAQKEGIAPSAAAVAAARERIERIGATKRMLVPGDLRHGR
ncbi:MAG: Glu/Leu/Phe/Val dehydrogenase [Chloroflexi bacterium]|nr:Glu/Leu/Phe/Val dehydrogenase [Chloroflexota bacterium]